MPKVATTSAERTKQFQDEMAAMHVGPKDPAVEAGGANAPRAKQRCRASEFGVLEYKYPRYSVELTEAQTLEDAVEPSFYSDIADKIIGGDKTKPQGRGRIIEVRKLSIALYAELLITETGPGFIRTKLLRSTDDGSVELPKDCPLGIKWNAGTKTHEVVRTSDNQVMRGGFQTQNGAAGWIVDHLKAMAA